MQSMDEIAKQSLAMLHKMLETPKSPAKKSARSLQPKPERREDLVEQSIPRRRNQYTHSKKVTSLLGKSENIEKMLKKVRYLKYLNKKIIPLLGYPFSQHFRISAISDDGIATIHTDSSSWAHQGRFLQNDFLTYLHRERLYHVKKIKIKIRPQRVKPAVEPPKHISISMATAQNLSKTAKKCDDELGAALQRLSQTLLRRNWAKK